MHILELLVNESYLKESPIGHSTHTVSDVASQYVIVLVSFHPEQSAVFVVAPLPKIIVVENPPPGNIQQAALSLFDMCYIIARPAAVVVEEPKRVTSLDSLAQPGLG
ncbi:hypothetical protein G7Y89_g14092 [Cudoniella acicularis]|uniref:Uncharacterized protein n=1 Tax=Cudoniella acicularis TaxID=354080 RepID=A0A8H4R8H7_9HELO|nr:hypothetical protein G7Y89_g14092 [Cudoniella acicularis]